MRFLTALALLVAVGCAREPSSSSSSQQQQPLPGVAEQVQVQPAPAPRKLTVRYKGRTADQWAELLHDADAATSDAAALALGQIGEEGVPYLLEGMDSRTHHVKAASLYRFPRPLAGAYSEELAPRLKTFLKHDNVSVRRVALSLIVAGRLADLAPDVAAAANRELDPQTRAEFLRQAKDLRGK